MQQVLDHVEPEGVKKGPDSVVEVPQFGSRADLAVRARHGSPSVGVEASSTALGIDLQQPFVIKPFEALHVVRPQEAQLPQALYLPA
jgi:hypothetical protein